MSTEVLPCSLNFNGTVINARTVVPAKGKGAGKVYVQFENPLEDSDSLNDEQKKGAIFNLLSTIFSLAGTEGVWRAIYGDVLRPACNHASNEARTDGKIVDSKWANSFLEYFTRASGERISEINEQIVEMQTKNNALIMRCLNGTASPEERRAALAVANELQKLTIKKQAKDQASDRRRTQKANKGSGLVSTQAA